MRSGVANPCVAGLTELFGSSGLTPSVLWRGAWSPQEPYQPGRVRGRERHAYVVAARGPKRSVSPNTAGVALRVPDVNSAREQLVAMGVEFLGDIVDTGVCLMGFFYDPGGNVLILHRRHAPSDG